MLTTDTLQITPEILSLIARIDEFKGAWRALGTLAPDRLTALRQVATIESIGSSKLTGASCNTLKQHFRALVERGALNQHGSGRGVWYDLQ